MGSYCNYTLGEWELESSKSRVNPELTIAFHEQDRKVGFTKEDGEKMRFIRYICDVKTAMMRLDALGYTVKNAEALLINNRLKWIKEYDYLLPSVPKSLKKTYLQSSIEDWIEAYKTIREKNYRARYGNWDDEWDVPNASDLTRLILGTEDTFYGFPAEAPYIFRLFLESCPQSLKVTLDISELVRSGYYTAKEKVCDAINAEQKIIILTEGSTDKEFLQKSLELLFPQMVDCYSFLDFSTFSISGGVDKVTHIVKTFSGAGIKNKIIALFDNDTVGVREYDLLKKLKLPSNITIARLPDIEIARHYPTIGPTGNVTTNVNGKACGLEMYLGKDVLECEHGTLEPIIWGGYVDNVGYQGEIGKKRNIQDNFRKKLMSANTNRRQLKQQDWSGLNLVWEHIFKIYL
jgi:hypothetical protein